MEDIVGRLNEIDHALERIRERQRNIDETLSRLDRQGSIVLSDVASVLREQARNNLETSRLLNDLSGEVTGLAFELEELKSWRKVVSGTRDDWVSEHRAEQSKLAYRAIKDGFNETEFGELIMNIGINPADISGDSIAEKALALVEYSRRNGLFWKLVKEGRNMRSNLLWPVESGFIGE